MQVMTTYNTGKPFTWSYSRLKSFESCPKRHWEIDIQKNVKEEEGEALLWGNEVHKHLANRIGKNTPLPYGFTQFESWVDRLALTEGVILTEQKLAITRAYGPTEWFAKDVWYRGIADVIKIVGPVALALDWKTGKILEDSQQLALMCACIFAHYPEVQKIRAEFIWLKDDASSRADVAREDMPEIWRTILPRVGLLENAHVQTSYPPKPSGLCKRFCPVTSCPYHGKGSS